MSDIPKDAFLIIIGAMKSGTTSLYSYIAQHPEICECRVKEPEYFTLHQKHGLKKQKYENLWNYDKNIHKYVLEGSTGYTKYPQEQNVPEKIRQYGLKPTFLYILRDPFERIESHYNAGRFNPEWNLSILDEHLINVSNYYMQLQRFRKYFPRERILLLDFNNLKTSPADVMYNIFKFLEINENFYTDSYDVMNETISGKKTNYVYGKLIKTIRINKIIPESIKKIGRGIISEKKPIPRKLLTEDERKKVYGILRKDMIKLRDEYGFDTGQWGF